MEKISPEKAMELLRKEGVEVTKEEAISIVSFMRLLADMVVSHYIKTHSKNEVKSGPDN